MKLLDFRIELLKGGAKGSGERVALGEQRVPLGPEDAQIQLAIEKR